MILFVDEDAMSIMGAEGAFMNNQVPKYVTRARASLMLGIPEAELSRISKESGLGRVERRQPGRNVLHLRGIAADLHGRGTPGASSPLNQCLELFDVRGILS